MKWRNVIHAVVHLLAAIAVVVISTISALNFVATSKFEREIGQINKEVAEMRFRQRNFDNNVVNWLMQLSENVHKLNLNKEKTNHPNVTTNGLDEQSNPVKGVK